MRPARALPYRLHADASADAGSVRLDLRNTGTAAAVLHVRNAGDDPRGYTVGAGGALADTWPAGPGYDLTVHGPNGFFRRFRGAPTGAATGLSVTPSYHGREYALDLELHHTGHSTVEVTVRDAYGAAPLRLSLRAGQIRQHRWELARSHGWYDLTVTVDGDGGFEYRYAGHLENGADSITDPVLGGLLG